MSKDNPTKKQSDAEIQVTLKHAPADKMLQRLLLKNSKKIS